MIKIEYRSKVDWWVYVVGFIMVGGCLFGPAIEGEISIGIALAILMAILWAIGFFGVKYEIKGNQLGVRNLFIWSWIPIEEIKEVTKTRGVLATAALSSDRISIKLFEKNSLKTSIPITISPKDTDGFLATIKRINPAIKISY